MMRFARASWITALLCAIAVCRASAPMRLEDPVSNPGFVHFYNNEFDEALAVFDREVKADPGNPDAYNHMAQTILYREMQRDGALESQLVSGSNPFLRRPEL